MEMTISKTYSETISRQFQTFKYTSTLTKVVEVNSAEELAAESEKLWKQVKALTEQDVKRDKQHRDTRIDAATEGDRV